MLPCFGLTPAPPSAALSTAPFELSCNSLRNPLGIDGVHPRLSWRMPALARGVRQTAYRIQVSTKPQLPVGAAPDVWDSGRIDSDRSVNVVYAGPPLRSAQRYYWRVQVWDQNGVKSPISNAAWWEMGLLNSQDWHARWIARDPDFENEDRKSSPAWIWVKGEDALNNPRTGKHQFRLDFDLSQAPQDATLLITGKDSAVAWINGVPVLQAKTLPAWMYPWGTFKEIPVRQFLKGGKNVLAVETTVIDGGQNNSAGFIALLRVSTPAGLTQRFITGPDWKAAYGSTGEWISSDFNDSSWPNAAVVAQIGQDPLGTPWPPHPASLLRHSFLVSKQIRSARLYATSLGTYQFHLNGQQIGDQILAPGWTDYRKQVVYQTYDVTSNLHQGNNTIGALLGDGWYATGLFTMQHRFNYGQPPTRLLAQLEITYSDGTRATIVSDESWKTAPSAIVRSEIYDGEVYDARLEEPGWDQPSFSDAHWSPVHVVPGPEADITAQNFQPIRATKTLHPISVTSPTAGVFVFDMGQNMVGWARLHVQGPRGTRVQLRFGEVLDAKGRFYRDNMRTAQEADSFILSGKGAETFQPHFTYHGFRYVEMTGLPEVPLPDAIEGVVFHTDAPESIQFHSGNPTVNRLWKNILWGQRGNFESVPTDCPQRDERLGWMGDAQVFWRTASFNANLDAFSHKFTRDIREAQSPKGSFTDFSPRVGDTGENTAGWGDAGIIIPWTAYMQYRDLSILDENWASMEKWMDHLKAANPGYLWLHDRGGDYGDWVAIGSVTSKDLIATAYWAYDATLMGQMAAALGKTEEAEKYNKRFLSIRDAFDRAYVKADGTVDNGSQTSYVLALHMQLLPEQLRAVAAAKLVQDIQAHQGHLTTGFIGTPYLLIELSNSGHSDVAYRLLATTSFPSWGYMVEHGATTMWERWNGDQMLNDPGMNSFNHYAYGAVGEWLYRFAAGIDEDPEDPGFQHILLHPQFDQTLHEARAAYQSPYGQIVSGWKYTGNAITWDVEIPPNTTATLQFPVADGQAILEGGQSLDKEPAIHLIGSSNGLSNYAAASGTYRFSIQKSKQP